MPVRIHKRFLLIATIIMILYAALFLPSVPVTAATPTSNPASSQSEDVIRVFFPLQKGFAQYNEKEGYSGYNYEYLMNIAQLTGWKYEFIAADSTNENLQNGLDAVKSGEYDLACSMVYYPQMEEEYVYSDTSYGATNYTLITLEDNKHLNARTIYDYPDLRIALVDKASSQTKLLDNYFEQQGLTYTPVYASDNDECLTLIESGKADAMISKDVVFLSGYKPVLNFANQPFYFASGKGNEALIEQLDWALAAMNSVSPDLSNQLYNKYFIPPKNYALSLTEEELNYLENAPTIKVAIHTNQAPIQDYDPKTEKFSGIMIDILDILSQKSGLNFELVAAGSEKQIHEMMADGTADMVAGIAHTFAFPESLHQVNYLLTSPILTLPVVRVNSVLKTASQDNLLVYSNIKLFQGEENVQYEEDVFNILEIINDGENKEAYVDGYIAQHYMKQGNFQNITLTQVPYGNYPVCFGISREEDLRLISILEQVICNLEPAEIENIVYQNTSITQQIGIMDFIKRNSLPFALIGFAILATVSALLLALFLKTRGLNRLIFAEKNYFETVSQTDSLTQILNNATFRSMSQIYLSESGALSGGALFILDIDHFKHINDTFGHLTGDETICALAELLKKVFDSDNIVGRLGGDEFAVLLKGFPSPEIAAAYCKQLMEDCLSISSKFTITLSIGVTTFRSEADFEELFKQADAALYEMKRQGRNCYNITEYHH